MLAEAALRQWPDISTPGALASQLLATIAALEEVLGILQENHYFSRGGGREEFCIGCDERQVDGCKPTCRVNALLAAWKNGKEEVSRGPS